MERTTTMQHFHLTMSLSRLMYLSFIDPKFIGNNVSTKQFRTKKKYYANLHETFTAPLVRLN